MARVLRMRSVDYFRPTSTGVTNHEYRSQYPLFVCQLRRHHLHLWLPGNPGLHAHGLPVWLPAGRHLPVHQGLMDIRAGRDLV